MAANLPANVDLEELLVNVLMQQDDSELELFVFYLESSSTIPPAILRKASRPQIARAILQFDRDNAVSATIRILRKMQMNQLANKLTQAAGAQG